MAGPTEQLFSCQSCRCRLVITDLESHDQTSPSGLLNGSVFAGGKVDESFILLEPSTRNQAAQGDPLLNAALPGDFVHGRKCSRRISNAAIMLLSV